MSVGRAFVGVGRTSKSARTRHLPLIQAPTGLKQTLSEDPSYPSSLISSSLCSLAAANITQRLMRCRRWPLRRLQQWPWQKRVKATPHWAPDSQALSSFLAMYFSTSLIPVPRLYRRGSRRARNPLHRARGPLQQPSSSANITSAGGSVTGRPKIMPLPPIYSRSAPPPPFSAFFRVHTRYSLTFIPFAHPRFALDQCNVSTDRTETFKASTTSVEQCVSTGSSWLAIAVQKAMSGATWRKLCEGENSEAIQQTVKMLDVLIMVAAQQ